MGIGHEYFWGSRSARLFVRRPVVLLVRPSRVAVRDRLRPSNRPVTGRFVTPQANPASLFSGR